MNADRSHQVPAEAPLAETPLAPLHRRLGAKMVPFAGYAMPLHYRGILAEHQHTRSAASLFDVSHMGQAILKGTAAAVALETLVVSDLQTLEAGKARYTLMTNEDGGIIDDLIVVAAGSYLSIVVNAANKESDFARIRAAIGDDVSLDVLDQHALLALQGPAAAVVMARFAPASRHMLFMTVETLKIGDHRCKVSRSGYTGEDGFEIAVPADAARAVADLLLGEPEVAPAGLGARDTLRLEAGMCLHGQDLDATTTPVEAGLAWTIQARRRREGGFPGAEVILPQLAAGPKRKRVGIRFAGRAAARAGAIVTDTDGTPIGAVTSGAFSPTLGVAVAMAYVEAARTAAGTSVHALVRDKPLAGEIVGLPFVPHRFVR